MASVHPDELLFLPKLENPALPARCWMDREPPPVAVRCNGWPSPETETGLCAEHLAELQEEDRRA